MEESGHYYTVYYTSLAVGFSDYVAYRHAVLSQMSDEVTAMDASELQQAQCLGWKVVDLNGVKKNVGYRYRFLMQNSQHSLVDKDSGEKIRSSEYQRNVTKQMLAKEDAISLKFGLLLHRLGDTFAHSIMGNERTMYTVNNSDSCGLNFYLNNFGHLIHGHEPDYPFLRKPLFHSYLVTLYEVLHNKFLERSSLNYRREYYKPGVKTRPVSLVINDFNVMFTKLENEVKENYNHIMQNEGGRRYSRSYNSVSDETKAEWFIKKIRSAAKNILDVDMEPFAPEKDHGMSLKEFLDKHKHLKDLNINRENILKSLREMAPPEKAVPLKNKAPTLGGG